MQSRESFCRHLRHALNHLYEPDVLRINPLVQLLLPAGEASTPTALSRTLVEAIEALKPGLVDSLGPPASRVYELLLYRYVHCARQTDLARQFHISVRQFRREQTQALTVLAEYLQRHFELHDVELAVLDRQALRPDDEAEETAGPLSHEFQWLQESAPDRAAALADELMALQDIVRPLAQQYQVRLPAATGDLAVPLAMPAGALRQVLLSLLTTAIHHASPGTVSIGAVQGGSHLHVTIRAKQSRGCAPAADAGHTQSRRDAEALLHLCSGTLTVSLEGRELTITAGLPLQDLVSVVVIDDNRDALQLLERYVAGTRYRLVASHDPSQALSLVEKHAPAVVVLDVMMAGLDGWQLLRQLRTHPVCTRCPIIICTVLAQREVAEVLGAADFLPKPVSRQAFLAALDQQCAVLGQGSGRGTT